MISANSLIKDWNGFYSWVGSNPKLSYTYSDTYGKEEDGNYTTSFNIPGYGKEDVSAKISNGVLSINVANRHKFAYKIPKKYDVYATKISVEKGVLTIKVPQKEEEVAEEFELTID
jgi:HSP20 family molecular chaperone IbpA